MTKELTDIVDKITLQPTLDRLLIYQDSAEEMTKAGLIIPDTAKEKPQTGWIVAVGTGKQIDSVILNHLLAIRKQLEPDFKAIEVPLEYKVGDHIMYGRYSGVEIEHNDIKLLIMREADVACFLDE